MQIFFILVPLFSKFTFEVRKSVKQENTWRIRTSSTEWPNSLSLSVSWRPPYGWRHWKCAKIQIRLNANLSGKTSSTVRTADTRSAQRWRNWCSFKTTNCQIRLTVIYKMSSSWSFVCTGISSMHSDQDPLRASVMRRERQCEGCVCVCVCRALCGSEWHVNRNQRIRVWIPNWIKCFFPRYGLL